MDEQIEIPEWIHPEARSVLFLLITSGHHSAKLLMADKLKPVWLRMNAALVELEPRFRHNAAAFVIGSFLNPLALYAETGTADRPTAKVRIRKNQAKAQSHLLSAAKRLHEAADELRIAAKCSGYLPSEVTGFMTLVMFVFNRYGISEQLKTLPSYFWGDIKTPDVLDLLAGQLNPGGDIWVEAPGMKSNKASWRDWLREAEVNLQWANRIYNSDFRLRETDWVRLAQGLISPPPSRDMVRDALRNPL